MNTHTIYLKITDKKGRSRIESRETWDSEKFLASVTDQYAKDKDNPCKVELSSRSEYLSSIKK